ncbi:MAG: endonuclease MutS2 [Clostridia bacterium]|nr:endonuclease MutS2 [Clostridia bacterium]
MNDKVLQILEYNRIIGLLEDCAGSFMAKERIKELKPQTDIDEIRDSLRSTTEAVDLIVHKGPLPLGNFYDIDKSVTLAYKGRSLTMKELIHVKYNMRIAREVVNFLKYDVPALPIINSMASVIEVFPRLEEKIDRCILSEDEMADNASPELRDIRKGIARQNDAIRARINNIINSSDNKSMLQDAIVTVRDGRFVVPIKQEHRAKFPGIIHDQSGSGATLFIEPQVIVELNNQLRELEMAEQVEIDRILAELSSGVAEYYHQLLNNQKLLADLDFIMAKGKLSLSMKGEEPSINEEQLVELKEARHPLIDASKVVPINVSLGGKYRTLVVTGPNTGGKTVTLKTIGLLSLMAQSGLHIPAASTSTLPIFEEIFADIGDEQSIEQSLSTFSSHMKNIVYITKRADERSLVLLDELGAGTDPTEGAALAISILEHLAFRGAMIAATTHYNELKKYAISSENVENASMEFDVETLSPTYRLLIGVPGKSNAFEISKKLGIKPVIINKARQLIEGKDLEFEDVISAIEEDKRQAAKARDEAELTNLDIKKREEALKQRERELEKKTQKLLEEAREDARRVLREAEETAKEVQKELKELAKMESLGLRNKEFQKTKEKLKDKTKEYQEKKIKEVNHDPVSVEELSVGDRVKVLSLDQNGEILSLPDDRDELLVQMGIMKMKVHLDDLVLINDGTKKKAKANYGNMFKTKAQNVSISINVQGEILDDAIMDVEKYLDDAYMAGLKEVTIIHGLGEGILRSGIRQRLRANKHVASYRKGGFSEGGDGVTVVKFKE